MQAKTGKVHRSPSPSWHRRERKARSRARHRYHQGRALPEDFQLLHFHHGSMPPSQKPTGQAVAKPQKRRGKGPDVAPQASRIEFALPQAMVTQDLWGNPTSIPGDLSVEQHRTTGAKTSISCGETIKTHFWKFACERGTTYLPSAMGDNYSHSPRWPSAKSARFGRESGYRFDGGPPRDEGCPPLPHRNRCLRQQKQWAGQSGVSCRSTRFFVWFPPCARLGLWRPLSAAWRRAPKSVLGWPQQQCRHPRAWTQIWAGLPIWVCLPEQDQLPMLVLSPRWRLFVASEMPQADSWMPLWFQEGAISLRHPGLRGGGDEAGVETSRPSKSLRRDSLADVPWALPATGTTPEALQRPQLTQIVDSSEPAHPDLGSPSWEARLASTTTVCHRTWSSFGWGGDSRPTARHGASPSGSDSRGSQRTIGGRRGHLVGYAGSTGAARTRDCPIHYVSACKTYSIGCACVRVLSVGCDKGSFCLLKLRWAICWTPTLMLLLRRRNGFCRHLLRNMVPWPEVTSQHNPLRRQAMRILLSRRCPALLQIPENGSPTNFEMVNPDHVGRSGIDVILGSISIQPWQCAASSLPPNEDVFAAVFQSRESGCTD